MRALLLILVIILSGPVLCSSEEITEWDYLQNLPIYSPVTSHSVKDLAQQTPYVAPAEASKSDPFTYMPHGQLFVPAGARVMIFVPHPDDESIAASGLIQRVLEREGKVRAVFVTNGDGYTYAVRLRMKNQRVSAKGFHRVREKKAGGSGSGFMRTRTSARRRDFSGFSRCRHRRAVGSLLV